MVTLAELLARPRVLNLAHRTDRWLETQSEFSGAGLPEPERVEAVYGLSEALPSQVARFERGVATEKTLLAACGIAMSHRRAWRQALDAGDQFVAVFEDDVKFHPLFVEAAEKAIFELPDGWRLLSFGGVHKRQPRRFSDRLVRPSLICCSHSYVLTRTAAENALDITAEVEPDGTGPCEDWDRSWNSLSPDFYVTWPHLAVQRDSFSDVARKRAVRSSQQFAFLSPEEWEGWSP